MIELFDEPEQIVPDQMQFNDVNDLKELLSHVLTFKHNFTNRHSVVAFVTVQVFEFLCKKMRLTKNYRQYALDWTLRRIGNYKKGYKIIDFENVFLPNRLNNLYFPTLQEIVWMHRRQFAQYAKEMLKNVEKLDKEHAKRLLFLEKIGNLENYYHYEMLQDDFFQ